MAAHFVDLPVSVKVGGVKQNSQMTCTLISMGNILTPQDSVPVQDDWALQHFQLPLVRGL